MAVVVRGAVDERSESTELHDYRPVDGSEGPETTPPWRMRRYPRAITPRAQRLLMSRTELCVVASDPALQ